MDSVSFRGSDFFVLEEGGREIVGAFCFGD